MSVTCDFPAALTNFDGAAYMGTWFQAAHVFGEPYAPDGLTCTQAEYSELQADGTFIVENTSQEAGFGARGGVIGTGYCPDATGQCFVAFYGPLPDETNYQVIATDYDNYSLVYTCDTEQDFVFLYYLSRTPVPSEEFFLNMVALTVELLPNFDFDTLVSESQGDQCTYQPVFQL